MIEAANLVGGGTIRHGFFSREGGVSDGLYASLNCGLASGDDPALVAENRARAMARLGVPAQPCAPCARSTAHGC